MNLREWQARHGYTYEEAAEALGVARRTYAYYLKMAALPKKIVLACEMIDVKKEMKSYANKPKNPSAKL